MRYFLLFFLFTYSFAVKDYLVKPKLFLNSVLYSGVTYYPERLDSDIGGDDKNIFKYSGHFRVIYGKSYEENETVQKLALTLLDIANTVWQKEIDEFGFKEPKNTDLYYVDIYIANTDAYNKAQGNYVTISDSYAGYATSYMDATPYFVINPDMDEDLLKVTVAHEFFHTVQYAYGLDFVSDEIWRKNIWFLEASATMMEDEVYDDINDYIGYLSYYVPYTNYAIDYTNGVMEYGKVLFAKFLKNRFSMNFIKGVFEGYRNDETVLQAIQKEALYYNESFDDLMVEYAECLTDMGCFKDSALFPEVRKFLLQDSKSVGFYGILYISSGADRYLYASNPQYLQSDFNGESGYIGSVNDNGLIFINKLNKNVLSGFLQYNVFNGYTLKKGWNLISNIFERDIGFEDLDANITWVLRDGKYCAYSKDLSMLLKIKSLDFDCKDNFLHPLEGAWVYVDRDKNLSINDRTLAGSKSYKSGIVGYPSVMLPENMPVESIWYYDEGNWSYFSDKEYNYQKIDKLLPGRGYIVKE